MVLLTIHINFTTSLQYNFVFRTRYKNLNRCHYTYCPKIAISGKTNKYPSPVLPLIYSQSFKNSNKVHFTKQKQLAYRQSTVHAR